MTAIGTIEFWRYYWGVNISGPGDHVAYDGSTVTITRAGRVPPPESVTKEKAIGGGNRPHESVHLYGYGLMFHGRFS